MPKVDLAKAFEDAARLRSRGDLQPDEYRVVLEILANVGGRTLGLTKKDFDLENFSCGGL